MNIDDKCNKEFDLFASDSDDDYISSRLYSVFVDRGEKPSTYPMGVIVCKTVNVLMMMIVGVATKRIMMTFVHQQ